MLENYFSIVLFSLITDSNWIMTQKQLQKWPAQTNISPELWAKLEISKQLHALWSEVSACYKNCWQMIAISCQIMFGYI